MKTSIIFKILKYLIVIACISGIVFIAFFPFPYRELTVKVYALKSKIVSECKFSAATISENPDDCSFFDFTILPNETVCINSLNIFGISKTTVSKVIGYDALSRLIESVENADYEWSKKGLVFKPVNESSEPCNVKVKLNSDYSLILKKQSAFLLQERLFMAGAFTCIMIILFIIVNVFHEKFEDKVNNHSFVFELKKFFSHIKKYENFMVYSARADLNAEVSNSYLNRLWWLLEPLFNMIVYVVVFGRVMGNSIANYATFVFSALLMWSYFNKTINYSVKLVRANHDIVSKVYVPKFVLLISNMFLNFFKLLFSLIVLVAMLFIFKVHIGVNVFWVIPAYMLMILLSFGIGMIFLHFGVYVDDLAYAVNILLTMLMFLSGIFYNITTTLPEPLNVLMMTFNPVSVFIDVMRNALLFNMVADLPLLALWFVGSILLCYIGVHIVYKNENSYVKLV
ncbi:MAG: ABC transporter permease [Treponemataceae bacterium]